MLQQHQAEQREQEAITQSDSNNSEALLELVASGKISLEAVLAFPVNWVNLVAEKEARRQEKQRQSHPTATTSTSAHRSDQQPQRKRQRRPASVPTDGNGAGPSTSARQRNVMHRPRHAGNGPVSGTSASLTVMSPTLSEVSSFSTPAAPSTRAVSPFGSMVLDDEHRQTSRPALDSNFFSLSPLEPERKLTILERRRLAKQERLQAASRGPDPCESPWLHSWSHSWVTTLPPASPLAVATQRKGSVDAAYNLVLELPKLSFTAVAAAQAVADQQAAVLPPLPRGVTVAAGPDDRITVAGL